jgi:hypothetical protein
VNVGVAPWQLFADIEGYEFVPFFWWGELTPEICPSISDTPYVQGGSNMTGTICV